MVKDLSVNHGLVSNFLTSASHPESRAEFRLREEQIEFFHEFGYLKGIRMLSDEQVDVLREELAKLMDPSQPGHELFYEYHSNESADPNTVLFHALGAWRIAPGFHDLLWNPRFTVPASQLLGGAVVTETVFSWPGVASFTVSSIANGDYPVVQAATMVFATLVILVNLLTDIAYSFLEPRVRFG